MRKAMDVIGSTILTVNKPLLYVLCYLGKVLIVFAWLHRWSADPEKAPLGRMIPGKEAFGAVLALPWLISTFNS